MTSYFKNNLPGTNEPSTELQKRVIKVKEVITEYVYKSKHIGKQEASKINQE